MWNTQTIWFDATVILAIFAVGTLLFGHFEEHRPKWRRLLKLLIVVAVFLAVAVNFGRAWALGMLVPILFAAAYIHLVWLPSHGINGWTGEPKEKYLELVKRRIRRPGDS